MKNNSKVVKPVLAALFLALGLVLPLLTGQIPQIGRMLLPMHLPVLLCGMICGWQYGAVIGLILPPLRSAIFGVPAMFPTAAAMAFELAAYGLIVGLLYKLLSAKKPGVTALYGSLIAAMLGGRIVWGVVSIFLYGFSESPFTWPMFLSGAFLDAIPGIIFQLVFIPVLMAALNKAGAVRFPT